MKERIQTEEVKMRRHDKQHFAYTQENKNITTINNKREIEEDGNRVIKLQCKTDKEGKKREGG
jgi:hypothetical protein